MVGERPSKWVHHGGSPLQVTRTTTCQYSGTLSTFTEYKTYTRETVQEAFCPCPSTTVSDDKQRIPFPNPGDEVSLRFPKSMQYEPGKTPYEEVWLGTVINVPLTVDDFNIGLPC